MMRYFMIIKDKSKSRERRSAPELSNQRNSNNLGSNRVSKFTGSASSPRSITEMYKEKEQNLRNYCDLTDPSHNPLLLPPTPPPIYKLPFNIFTNSSQVPSEEQFH
ncbi:Protein kinase domain-containing protein [Forsythia ovata]|uniref:Protein kinase domain-containing protein n=1 Tax=Forsythia ovata TaxID=205694 RepID=A0ABD1Q1B2_9LAMI